MVVINVHAAVNTGQSNVTNVIAMQREQQQFGPWRYYPSCPTAFPAARPAARWCNPPGNVPYPSNAIMLEGSQRDAMPMAG